ncbi:MAG: CopG family transcriptional regulator [Terriglobia bacterium]
MAESAKTNVQLPEDLLLEAKRKALETRTTLSAILERALRRELRQAGGRPTRRPRRIRWVTSAGGLPPGLDISDRSKMWDWMQQTRTHARH